MAQPALKIVVPNDLELSEAERRALLARVLYGIEELETEKKAISDEIKAAKKNLADNGFSKDAIAYGLKLRSDDGGKMELKRRAETEVARFLNHPIGTQPELPLNMEDRTPGVDKAKAEGEIAGAEGKTCSAPYADGSPNGQAWISGWHDGQATITSAFKKLEAKAAAEPVEDDEADEN